MRQSHRRQPHLQYQTPGNNFASAVLNHRNGLTHSFMIPEPELARRVFSPLAGLFAGPTQSQRSRLDPQRRHELQPASAWLPSSDGVLYRLPLASRIDRRGLVRAKTSGVDDRGNTQISNRKTISPGRSISRPNRFSLFRSPGILRHRDEVLPPP
jgi:hypothetical protein